MANFLHTGSESFIWIVLSLILLIISKFIYGFKMSFNIDEELKKSNMAFALAIGGYFIGIVIILIAAFIGPSKGFIPDLKAFLSYSFIGIILLNISRLISDKCILYKFCDIKEIVEDRNIGTGVVHFGSHIASALIVAGAIHGEGGSFLSALAFFSVGQLALIAYSKIYNAILPYDLHDEIEKDNAAVGIAFAGNLIALGIIVMNGMVGDFTSWKHDFLIFCINVLLAFILLPIFRIFIGKIIIPKINLNKALAEDRNSAAAFIEMTSMICFALIVYFVLV